MRIAQVAPLYENVPPTGYGGTERVIAGLCDGLVERATTSRCSPPAARRRRPGWSPSSMRRCGSGWTPRRWPRWARTCTCGC